MTFEDFIEKLAKVVTVKLIASIVVGSIATYALIDNQSKQKEESTEVAESEVNKDHTSKNFKKNRSPSSLSSNDRNDSVLYKPTAKITSYNKSNFEGPDISTPNENQESLFSNTPTPYPLPRQEAGNDSLPSSKSNTKPNTKIAADEMTFRDTGTTSTTAKKSVVKKEATTPSSSSSSASTSSSTPIENSCSTNIVGGTFGNPVGITLACNYPSTIKYCLSSTGVCCDPESGGTTYSSQVIIGPKNGNYCLSYFGDSTTGGDSIVYQQNYTINSTFPNLTVGHSKIFYQTTELIGTSFISGLDFGKPNFSVGQINLKTHDPGPADLNYDCDEIISNYVTLPAPAPIEVLPLFDVSLAPLSSQVEIPLRLDQLAYGDNFITSYIENNSYVIPLYSCSTTKVNLDDFEYFQVDVSQSVAGDNSTREFEGEFSSYGFFEDDAVVFRGPAGVNTVEKTGENLKSGMYGMFY